MMSNVFVIVIAVLVIGFIGWWFFGKHEKQAVDAQTDGTNQSVDVLVNGGYSPATVVLKKDVPAVINFNRKDESSCLERVVFSENGINQFLPQNEVTTVPFDTSKAGEFDYACGMNMFHGKVIVK